MRLSRPACVAVLGILLLAFALRLIALDTREVWYDDTFSILLARQELPGIASGTAADTMPPLYYVLLHYWMYLGQDPFTLRFLNVMISTVVVGAVYLVARRTAGQRAALLSALLTAVAPFQVYHAQELRMYALLALALTAYMNALILLWSARHDTTGTGRLRRALILLAVFGSMALYTHNLAAITLIAGDAFLLWRRQWRTLLQLVASQVASVLLFLPWLVYVPGQLEKIQRAFWTLRPGVADVLQMIMAFTTNLPLPAWFLPVALFAGLGLVTFALLEILRARRRLSPEMGMMLVFAMLPPAALFVLSYVVRPVFVPRGVILSSLAYYVLLAWLFARLDLRAAAVLLGALMAVFVPSLAYQYGYQEFPRSPFRQTDAYVQRNLQPGDSVVHDNKLTFFPMYYYDGSLPHAFLADPPGSANDTLALGSMDALQVYPTTLDDVLGRARRVWFVIFQRAIDEAEAEGHPQGNKAWMDGHYRQVSLTRFNDLNVYLYSK